MQSGRDIDATPISQLIDIELRRADGSRLGVIDELLIDLRSGRVEYLMATGRNGERLRFPWRSIALEHGRFVVHRTRPSLIGGSAPAPGSTDDA